ncbi:hypothetical protein ABFA07_023620 [Porites harrisoni]
MADYFLSLNVASSKQLVDKARGVFHSRGITTWMCTDIDGGDSFRDEILANVRDAKVFLIFVNEKWAKSQECAFEFNYAMRKNLVKNTPKIMPFVIEMFDMEKYPHVDALLANCQGVFLNSCSSEIDAFKQIMDKLQGVVPMKAATAAAALKPVPTKLSDEESKEVSIVRKSLTTKGAQTLPSGNWQGYFIDGRALRGKASGSKWLINVSMNFQNSNQFTAKGQDEIGPFTFANGKISGSTVQFAKQYARHRVLYEGAVKGVQMMGRWRLESSPSIKGEWAMWPVGGGR